ncbi:MAG: T9SS C-terminal target domain-containing protein, partial [Calditrichaeota bacterium]
DDPAVEAAGISRFPDGIDTDVNNQDFSLRCITPGESNTALAAQCLACEITDLSAGTQTPCDPITNTYTQEVIVSYSNPPATGNLIVNGQSFPITGSPQTVVLTNLPADGLPVDVTAAFSDEASCALTEAALFTAPGGCSEPRSQVVLLALNGSIRLRQGVDVLAGDVIVNQAATGATLNDDVGGAELYVGKRANIATGYRAMADDILMKTDARIDGEAHYNALNDTAFGGTVVGSRYTPLALPVFSSLPAFETGTPGSNDVVVAPGDTRILAPGPYGNLTVGDSATVVFTGGVYDCREIRAGTKARLVFQSLTRVRVAERVAVGRRAYIGPGTGAAIDASGIIFFVNGSDGNGTPLTPPPAVDVGNRSEIQANFYAPNGTCELGKRTNFTGAVLAQHIDVGKHAHLRAANFFGSSAFGKVAASGGPAPGRPNRSLTPRSIRLAQNYPNPFNPRTTIRFYLPQSSSVTLKIFDMSGRLIRTLIREDFPAGEHRVTWDATDDAGAPVASGVYLYRLQVGSTALVRKMTLLR